MGIRTRDGDWELGRIEDCELGYGMGDRVLGLEIEIGECDLGVRSGIGMDIGIDFDKCRWKIIFQLEVPLIGCGDAGLV